MEAEEESPIPSPVPSPVKERTPSPEPEDPIPDRKATPKKNTENTNGDSKWRRRKRKLVPKTYLDDEGFMGKYVLYGSVLIVIMYRR